MKFKHTKGPWRVAFSDGSGPEYINNAADQEHKSIAKVRWGCSCCEDLSPLTEEEIANAALISAAPQMAELLHKFYTLICEGKTIGKKERWNVWEVLCKATPAECKQIVKGRKKEVR